MKLPVLEVLIKDAYQKGYGEYIEGTVTFGRDNGKWPYSQLLTCKVYLDDEEELERWIKHFDKQIVKDVRNG